MEQLRTQFDSLAISELQFILNAQDLYDLYQLLTTERLDGFAHSFINQIQYKLRVGIYITNEQLCIYSLSNNEDQAFVYYSNQTSEYSTLNSITLELEQLTENIYNLLLPFKYNGDVLVLIDTQIDQLLDTAINVQFTIKSVDSQTIFGRFKLTCMWKDQQIPQTIIYNEYMVNSVQYMKSICKTVTDTIYNTNLTNDPLISIQFDFSEFELDMFSLYVPSIKYSIMCQSDKTKYTKKDAIKPKKVEKTIAIQGIHLLNQSNIIRQLKTENVIIKLVQLKVNSKNLDKFYILQLPVRDGVRFELFDALLIKC